MKLLELIADAPAVAMLGMCKNAGKTTAMNRLIRELAAAGVPGTGLTSIGRDGESRDLVTGTAKPPIYMFEGMLAATAEQLLPVCDVSRELLAMTGLHTSLGEVVLFRARSDGFVQLAGPGIVEQLTPLREMFADFGADRVLIDGALSRRSPAAGAADGACILSTGASLDRDLDRVVAETAYVARLLSLPVLAAPGPEKDRITLFRRDQGEAPSFRAERPLPLSFRAERSGVEESYPSLSGEEKIPRLASLARDDNEDEKRDANEVEKRDTNEVEKRDDNEVEKRGCSKGEGLADFPALIDALRRESGPATALLSGALSEAQAKALLQSGTVREGLTLLVGDGSRLLLRRETCLALEARGARFAVLRGTRLAAVTVNPVSAGGWRFDARELREKMAAAVAVPVVDVEDD